MAELAWRKSSYSANGSACVEVAWPKPVRTAVRDSKNVTGPTLDFDTSTWRAFLRRI